MALIFFLSSYWFPIFWCLFIRLIKLDFTLSWLTVNRQTAFPAKKSLIYKEIPRDKTYDSGGKQLLIISSVRVKIKRTTYAGLKSTRCRKKHYFLWAEAVIVESHLPAQRVYNDKLYEMMPLNLINLNALIIPQPCDRWLSKTKLLLPSAVPLTWCRRRFWWDLNTDLVSSLQTLEPGAYPGFTSLSPPEQSTPVQPRNPELEQRAKAMRGRMWVHRHCVFSQLLRPRPQCRCPAVSSAVVTVRCFLFVCSGLFWRSWFRRRKTTSKTWASWWRWGTHTFMLTPVSSIHSVQAMWPHEVLYGHFLQIHDSIYLFLY